MFNTDEFLVASLNVAVEELDIHNDWQKLAANINSVRHLVFRNRIKYTFYTKAEIEQAIATASKKLPEAYRVSQGL